MNFYKRFIGDIQAKTGGLTLAEFGAYDRLLDHYYSTEQPVPAGEVYRICRAMGAAERGAVDRVLARFFEETPAGWAQGKADEQIAKAQPLIEAARENGKKGGRPPKPKTQQKPTGFQKHNPNGESSPKPDPDSSSLRSEETLAATQLVGQADAQPYKVPSCPHEEIVRAYAELLPTLPQVAILSDVRRGHIAARWKAVCADQKFTREQGLEWFREYFALVSKSVFLTGNGKPNRETGRVWSADFDWLFLPTNFVKVVEGRYQERKAA